MEQPNLKQIHEIAGGDDVFIDKMLAVLCKEFPKEKEYYHKCINEKDFIKTAEIVHKLKHKISILGLENGYVLARDYENALREGEHDLKEVFEKVLKSIEDFLGEF